jgi:glycosyltransferase involved in cell wall biosynthesis
MKAGTSVARIAYFYREMSEYIDIDLKLLRAHHTLDVTGCPNRWPDPLATWRKVADADLVWTWFASWHALLPGLFARLQCKPFIVCVGGYDTACLPAIGYGHQRGGLRALVARMVVALATRLPAVSEFAIGELRAMGVADPRVTLVPHGLDPARYTCSPARDAGLVVTIGGVNHSNLTRKGLEPFVRAARELPNLEFVVVGAWQDDAIEHLRALATPNVSFTGALSHEDKVALLAKAAVVVQASQHEAFGLSLAEGMLCGATPVVTNAGALPWVAGGTGAVAASQEPAELARAIRDAIARGPQAGAAARARVLAHFTLASRAEQLEAIAGSCVGDWTAPAAEDRRTENPQQAA